MMRRLLSSLVVLLWVSACAPTEKGDPCLQDTECGTGFICEHKVDCEASGGVCPTGSICEDQNNGTSFCKLDSDGDGTIGVNDTTFTTNATGSCELVPCESDEDCPGDLTCAITPPDLVGVCEDAAE